MRARGVRVGFIGLAAQKLPHLFADAADFIVDGEPEAALQRALCRRGAERDGVEPADRRPRRAAVSAVGAARAVAAPRPRPVCGPALRRIPSGARLPQLSGVLHLLPAPDPVDATARVRWPTSSTSCHTSPTSRGPLHIVFRDPLFSQDRDRVLALCDGIRSARAAAHLRVRDPSRPARRRTVDASCMRPACAR